MNSSIAVFCLLAFIGGCSWLNQKAGLDDDNIIEENVEALIHHNTGLNVDLSPESDER